MFNYASGNTVYNLLTTAGIDCLRLYTVAVQVLAKAALNSGYHRLMPGLPKSYTFSYTHQNTAESPQLNSHLSTLSTPPIITTKKKR